LEGRTEGLKQGTQAHATLSLIRLIKKDTVPIVVNGKNLFEVDINNDYSYRFGKDANSLPDLNDYAGTFEIGYKKPVEPVNKGYWYIQEITKDPKKPILLLLRNQDQFSRQKDSEDFILLNGTRIKIAKATYDIKIE
jgi:hypothetical protein